MKATRLDRGTLFIADAVELVTSLPDKSVDCVVMDPAYESLEKWRATGTTTRLSKSKGSSNEWFETFPNARYLELFTELFRVMKGGTHLYMFCDEETRDHVCCGWSPQTKSFMDPDKFVAPLVNSGFKYWKAIIWDKCHPGMGYHYRAQHEFILLAEKVQGKHRKLNDLGTSDVLSVPRLKGKDYWPTEKPLPLVWKLIQQSTQPGDVVLDPFVGSGTTALAAAVSGRKFIVGDIDPKAIERAVARLTSKS